MSNCVLQQCSPLLTVMANNSGNAWTFQAQYGYECVHSGGAKKNSCSLINILSLDQYIVSPSSNYWKNIEEVCQGHVLNCGQPCTIFTDILHNNLTSGNQYRFTSEIYAGTCKQYTYPVLQQESYDFTF